MYVCLQTFWPPRSSSHCPLRFCLLATVMGRGQHWSAEDLEILRGAIALGLGAAAIKKAYSTWSLSSIKKKSPG